MMGAMIGLGAVLVIAIIAMMMICAAAAKDECREDEHKEKGEK